MKIALFKQLILFCTVLPHLILITAIEVAQIYQIHNLSLKDQISRISLDLSISSGSIYFHYLGLALAAFLLLRPFPVLASAKLFLDDS
jgi:hypothetical protein